MDHSGRHNSVLENSSDANMSMQSDTALHEPTAARMAAIKQRRRIKFSCDDDADDDQDSNDASSIHSDESFTLRDRQDAINTSHPFGIRIWKPAIYKKKRSVEQAAEEDIRSMNINRFVPLSVKLGNVFWAATFGVVLWTLCFSASIGLSVAGAYNKSCIKYASTMRSLSFYLLWPFGKYVQLKFKQDYLEEDEGLGRSIADYLEWQTNTRNREQNRHQPLFFAPQRRRRLSENFHQERRRRFFGRGKWSAGRVAFYCWFWLCLTPVTLVISAICWLSVVMVPMARVLVHTLHHLRTHPLALSFRPVSTFSEEELTNQERYSVILCTYRAGGLKYYKFTVDGTNIIILNLVAAVIFSILDFFLLNWLSEGARFALSLLSIVPLAHYIGQAVASISAQSSMSMGATINAFFSTLVEVFLYMVALQQGKGELVEGSITGSIMAGTILLPGLSMCAGALKKKTQRFNPMSTGATSTMLLFAIVGVFAPTFWFQIYGSTALQCNKSCFGAAVQDPHTCLCRESPALLRAHDFTYINYIRPFAIISAVCLAVGYIIGLFFTLRTHASSIWATASEAEDDTEGGHDLPNWSRTKSYVILISATIAYAIIAEILVDSVDIVLDNVAISPKLLGITVFALVPNTTEFLNAISFAINGNVALSLEIGSAYALQVCMLQIPALVLFSLPLASRFMEDPLKDHVFSLVFPRWDLLVSVLCVLLYQNAHTEGKSNYFKGSVLLLAYVVLTAGFYFDDELEEAVRQGSVVIAKYPTT